jgi:hypothetical protein
MSADLHLIRRYPHYVICHFFYDTVCTLCYVLDDVKAIYMMECVLTAFKMVKEKLEGDSYFFFREKYEGRNLHRFLLEIRGQAAVCGNYLAPLSQFSCLFISSLRHFLSL